jgi:hypothetical protein
VTKHSRFDTNLREFDHDLADVQARVESLAEKMSTTAPKNDVESDTSTTSSALHELMKSDLKDIGSFGSSDRFGSTQGNDIELPKRYVAQGRSPVERALVKSMNHLSTILARLQTHDSLLSGTSSKSSPEKL